MQTLGMNGFRRLLRWLKKYWPLAVLVALFILFVVAELYVGG